MTGSGGGGAHVGSRRARRWVEDKLAMALIRSCVEYLCIRLDQPTFGDLPMEPLLHANDSSGPSRGTIDKRVPQKCPEAVIFRGPRCDKTPGLPCLAQHASALHAPSAHSPRV